ncbi:uncharacterized protein LOC136028250 [Artemia franciscana]|uniref:uncharacterized protein LOC136028250 n=1 Tax=Artemia franciscana TaxID=6661 RepID=UPI0032DB22AA
MSKIRSYRPARFETVKSFAERLLLSLLNDLPEGIPEVHIVADRYDGLFGKLMDTEESISLKSACRFRRGKGKNLQINALSTIEESDAALANSASKSGLLEILCETWEKMGDQLPNAPNLFLSGGLKERLKVSLVERGCSPTLSEHCDYKECLSSRHKEADQHLITHTKYARNYACSIVVHANDTDVAVACVYCFEEFQAEGLSKLFLKFPTYIIPVHELADGVHLSKEEQIMLPFVHCLSGCDTTNFFFGVGKASFLNATASPTFASKMVSVTERIKDAEGKLSVDAFREVYDLSKSLVIEMYGKQAGFNSPASVRAYIWCQKQDVRRLLPSDDTFEPCIRRAIFAKWIILSSVQARPNIPDPLLHG